MTLSVDLFKRIRPEWRLPLAALYIGLLFAVYLACFFRDCRSESQYPGDLRNRVVGSRLQNDSRSPYFYKWSEGDPIKYYDPANNGSHSVSNITASPAFHYLMSPISALPQRTVSIIWLFVQYLSWALIVFLITRRTSLFLKLSGLTIGVLFLLTDAWKLHVVIGQNYIIPALLAAVMISFGKRDRFRSNLVAALANIALVATRPIAAIVTMAALLRLRTMRTFILLSALLAGIFVVFTFTNSFQTQLWKDYRAGVAEHTKLHQGEAAARGRKQPDLPISEIEGFRFRHTGEGQVTIDTENANVFVLYKFLAGRNMPLSVLTLLAFVTILGLMAVFYPRRNFLTKEKILVFGYLLYIALDLFSPVHRHQYYSVQWLPMLLWALMNAQRPAVTAALLTGLFLQVTHIGFIPMKHTIGEAIWMISCLFIIWEKPRNVVEQIS